jgi:hypothetical protein
MRALNVLLDRPIMMPSDDLCGALDPDELPDEPILDGPPPAELHAWCVERGVSHYVDLAPTRVVVHFTRLGEDRGNRWKLYRVGRDGFEFVETKPLAPLPQRVPVRSGQT